MAVRQGAKVRSTGIFDVVILRGAINTTAVVGFGASPYLGTKPSHALPNAAPWCLARIMNLGELWLWDKKKLPWKIRQVCTTCNRLPRGLDRGVVEHFLRTRWYVYYETRLVCTDKELQNHVRACHVPMRPVTCLCCRDDSSMELEPNAGRRRLSTLPGTTAHQNSRTRHIEFYVQGAYDTFVSPS